MDMFFGILGIFGMGWILGMWQSRAMVEKKVVRFLIAVEHDVGRVQEMITNSLDTVWDEEHATQAETALYKIRRAINLAIGRKH